MTAYNMIVLIQSLSILILAVGAIYLISNWRGKEYSYLVLFCIVTLVNNIGALIEIIAHNKEEILIGTKFSYIGKVFIPLTFFLFIMQYCEIEIPKKVQLLLAVFHLSIAVMVFSYPLQKWFYTSVGYTTDGLFPHNIYGHGVMYNVYTVCLVLYFLVIFTVIIRILEKEKRRKRRMQMCYMLASSICAIAGFLIFLLGVTGGYDTTSLSYAICTIFMAIALAKYDLLDTVELARNYVIDNLSLEIIALDEDDRIIYYNQPLLDVYPDFEEKEYEIVNYLVSMCKEEKMVEIGEKVYKPEYKELVKNGAYRGHIITLSDITDNYNYTKLMKKMTEIDSLTGLYNRFAYEYRISEIKKKKMLPENLIFFVMDINGLKNVNDSKGHDAGDSLIYDAAQCILRGIGGYGDCYRVGGDEFAAIIMADDVDPNTIIRKIKEEAQACVNEMYTVSISVGYCVAKENDGMCLEDFEKIADQRMYQDKESYYLSRGINRRARDEVFRAIYDSYIMIMKVNLDSGEVDVIKKDILEEDVKMYLKKTDPSLLRRQFLDDKNKCVRMYDRRQVGDTYHKVMMEIIPKKEYCEEEPIVFIYVKDMEMEQ
ncbi:MAG: histidine kinase N-terminal 7TM domain-containing protein [Wujia sp.]